MAMARTTLLALSMVVTPALSLLMAMTLALAMTLTTLIALALTLALLLTMPEMKEAPVRTDLTGASCFPGSSSRCQTASVLTAVVA